MSPSDSVIRSTYQRIKRERPDAPEGTLLDLVADALGLDRLRVGEALREKHPTVKRYAIILPAAKFPSGGT